jgi:hypothetical protein
MRCSIWLVCGIIGTAANAAELAKESQSPSNPAVAVPMPNLSVQPPSRVDFFRRLLAMTPAEREQALAAKTEGPRKVLLEKIQEYDRLSPEDRESRLRSLELYDCLLPLMKLRPDQRAEKLAIVPEKDHKLIEERLKQWDLLPPEFQEKVLENELTVQYFIRLEPRPPPRGKGTLLNYPEADRKALEENLARWHAMPLERRQKMFQHINQFFEMPAKEKEKTLKTLESLPDGERQKMERSLETFATLPPDQRQMCIEAFRKFASMSKGEMTQFLRNAERWHEMSPQDRETWRNLVNLLPGQSGPPLPPGVVLRAPPLGTNKPPGSAGGAAPFPKAPGAK